MYKMIRPSAITTELIVSAIMQHQVDATELYVLQSYYLNQNEVKAKVEYGKEIKNGIAAYIVRTANSYFIGSPVNYNETREYDDETQVRSLDPILDLYRKQDKATLDKSLGKDCSIFGKAYELIYMSNDAKPMPKSVKLSPLETFVMFDTSAEPESIFAVNYQKLEDIYYIEVYTDSLIMSYKTGNLSDKNSYSLIEAKEHYFKRVPVTLYQNNEEELGDFELSIANIDAYNKLETDRAEDVGKFINSLLKISGTTLGDTTEEVVESASKIKRSGILELPEDGDAGFITNTLNQEHIQVFADNLKENIHMYSFVPNLADKSFSSDMSGVAIRYKLLGLEQLVQDKELSFVKGLKRRLKVYKETLLTLDILAPDNDFDMSDIEVVFNRNLPQNDYETAQMIQLLSLTGNITPETLINQLSFIQDANREVANSTKNKIDNFDYKLFLQDETVEVEADDDEPTENSD